MPALYSLLAAVGRRKFGEWKGNRMADLGPFLVTGAADQLRPVGRPATRLLIERGLAVRVLVGREDDRAAASRAAGADVVVGDFLELADVSRVLSGYERVLSGMSVSPEYAEMSLTTASVARKVAVDDLAKTSRIIGSLMSIQYKSPMPQERQH
jgi:hypothetical protein